MKKIKIAQADIDANPLLKKIGAKAGMTMEFEFVSSEKTTRNEQSESNEDDDTGGGNPPPDKGKPDKP